MRATGLEMGSVGGMGQKPAGKASQLSLGVIREIEAVRRRRRPPLTVEQLVRSADMGVNTYYTTLRGDRPLNTNELDRLATALGLTVEFVLGGTVVDVGGAVENAERADDLRRDHDLAASDDVDALDPEEREP